MEQLSRFSLLFSVTQEFHADLNPEIMEWKLSIKNILTSLSNKLLLEVQRKPVVFFLCLLYTLHD